MIDSLLSDLMSDKYKRSVCEEPFCGCFGLNLKERENSKTEIGIDCIRRIVSKLPEACPLNKQSFQKKLSDDDWDTLLEEFIRLKWLSLEKTPDRDLVSSDFDFYDISENGRLVGFHEIFPALGAFHKTCNGTRIVILDSYCIRSGCQCGEASLEFIRIDENGDGQKTIARFDLNLDDMMWKSGENIKEDSTLPCRQTLKDFLAEPGLQKHLRKRQKILHETYMRSIDTHGAGVMPSPYVAEVKPGRNEPCPCGSGKKYKKCCARNV